MKRKITVTFIASAMAAVTLCSLAVPQDEDEKPKNLKVLSKKISAKELIDTMDEFNASLGVKCNFCHASSDADPSKLDYASDRNKHKDEAREMMRMTNRINKKYFGGAEVREVTCYTCHHGEPDPPKMPISKN
ncbi:photosynthetic reaction center cytochrome c subunit [Chitinophaga skermanii]|uniref:Photosynthetic reaction center cytochrome c subunit n=1 Tax=Chitinophaga skermanii TaxID=331697 RepID=A0A327QHG9_9BACT|nr:c-type cytochrome [Chitinophaga skermanii]RAJ04056.1 photosynthetic reaction center cytochrome c subunit [Chitinophaga skermanii]